VQQPAAAEILLTGTTLQASVVVKGAGPLNYSWYFNSSTPILNASNATLTVSNLGIANSGRYDCVISNPYGSITSSVLSLTVVASTTNPVVLTWADGTANMLWDWTSPNWLQGATTTNWHSAAGGIAHFGATGAGTVNLAASPPISVSSMTFDSEGYTLASNAMTLDGDSATITNNAETTVISNVLTGTSGLTIEGTGSLALGNVNTYSGGTIVNGGTLFANAGNTATGAVGGGNVTVNSGSTITVGGDNSFVGGATVASITITINAGGIVSDTNAIDSGDGSTCHLDALLLNGGTLAATTANDDWGNWDFDFGVSTPGNGSTSYISGGNAALTQGGGTVFNIGANDTVIVTTSLAHTTDAGDNGLIKTGSGTLTLNGDNTSTGGQFVNGGILNGNGDISGPVIVNAGGTLAAGTPSAIGQLTILSAPLTLNAGSTTMLRIDRTADTFDSIVSISALTYGGTLSVTNLAGTLAAGHSFPVFAADSYSGGSNDFSLPALAAGLSWDLSKLTANGSIAVVSGAAPLFFNPPAGSYILGAQTVTITCLTPGATIYYTTNGTTPTSASSSGLSPVTVIVPANTTMTIQAFGQATGYTATAVASATYTTASAAVWINPAGGSWETPSDWTNGIIPNQNGGTADFSQLTLTTNTYVTLDGTPTIGNLIFCDVGNKWTWEIDPGTGGPLTLAAGTNTPAITVKNQAATITAGIAGINGLSKDGTGTLALTFVNTYSGGTAVNAGTLFANAGNSGSGAVGSGNVTVNSGGTITVGGDNSFVGYGTSGSRTVTINAGGTISNTNTSDGGEAGSTCHLNALVMNGGTLVADIPNNTWGNWNFDYGVSTPGNGSSSFISGGNVALTEGGGTVFNIGANDTLTVSTALATVADLTDQGLIKTGSGTLTLNGDNTATANEIVNGGTLDGYGTISAPVIVNAGGTLGAGTPSAIGQLVIANTLTLNAGSITFLRIKPAAPENDSLTGISALTYGGTLTVTNLDGTLAAGDSFKLFSAASYNNNFTTLNLPALGSGLAWDWTPTSGTLAVVSSVPVPVLSGTVTLSGTSFSMSFTGVSGQGYAVLMTTNLILPLADWTSLTNGTFGSSPVDFTDPGATNEARFYRIKSP
jgi:autotransporter-associated beta strand protein